MMSNSKVLWSLSRSCTRRGKRDREENLTEMVDDIGFAPLRAVGARLLGAVGDSGIEHEIVNLILSQLFQRLLGERLDRFQVGQFKQKQQNTKKNKNVLQLVVRRLRPL